MINKASRAEIREKKHRRIRHHLNGTATTPRLAVYRSNKHMYAQIIDDSVGKTLVSASTLQKDVKQSLSIQTMLRLQLILEPLSERKL